MHMPQDYLVNDLYLQKTKLKGPLSRGSHFNIYFRLERRGNRGSRQNFHGIPFFQKKMHINNLGSTRKTCIYHDHILIYNNYHLFRIFSFLWIPINKIS